VNVSNTSATPSLWQTPHDRWNHVHDDDDGWRGSDGEYLKATRDVPRIGQAVNIMVSTPSV
jgi:hypothetical protein